MAYKLIVTEHADVFTKLHCDGKGIIIVTHDKK